MTIISRFSVLLAEKELKEGRKYTYREIEQITGVNKNTIGLWVKGKVQRFDSQTIESLCNFLGCQPGELLVKE
jgi:DNA-binding Xre family transcriptional regulator